MGRPSECNPCCGGGGPSDPTDPPITDCDKAICVAFLDHNNNNSNYKDFSSKMTKWASAYPDRLLFVLDTQVCGTGDQPNGLCLENRVSQ